MAIQSKVLAAVDAFTKWQRTIGRDINPSKLAEMVMAAGCKRAEISAPVYTVVSKKSVSALAGDPVIQYGGLEDD